MIPKTMIVALMLFVRASNAMTLALDPEPEPQDRYDLLREITNLRLPELKDPLNALLNLAIEKGDALMVQLALNIRAHETALLRETNPGHLETISILLNTDTENSTVQGEAALCLAAQRGTSKLLKLSLEGSGFETMRTDQESLSYQPLDHGLVTPSVVAEAADSSNLQNN